MTRIIQLYNDDDGIYIDNVTTIEDDSFVLCDENGVETTYHTIATYDNEGTGKSYILYTDNTVDEDGRTEVYVSVYEPDSKPKKLTQVQTEEEFITAENILNMLLEEVNHRREPTLEQYIEEIKQVPDLTIDQKVQLLEQAKAGDKAAKQALVEANLKRVIEIAEKFRNRVLVYYDLIDVGNYALVEAIDSFEGSEEGNFDDYIEHRIRQAMRRLVASHDRAITIPPAKAPEISRMITNARRLLKKLGREPSAEEIAKESNMTVDEVTEYFSLLQK